MNAWIRSGTLVISPYQVFEAKYLFEIRVTHRYTCIACLVLLNEKKREYAITQHIQWHCKQQCQHLARNIVEEHRQYHPVKWIDGSSCTQFSAIYIFVVVCCIRNSNEFFSFCSKSIHICGYINTFACMLDTYAFLSIYIHRYYI